MNDNKNLREVFFQNDLKWVERNDPIYQDPLSKVLNRAGYDVFMPRLLEEAKGLGIPLVVSVLDIDNFKAYNERYGRHEADETIHQLTGKLQADIMGTDYMFKYGGDELVFAFRNLLLKDAMDTVIPKIRHVVEEIGLEASIGTTDLQEGDDTAKIFERADALMHAEKDYKKRQKNG